MEFEWSKHQQQILSTWFWIPTGKRLFLICKNFASFAFSIAGGMQSTTEVTTNENLQHTRMDVSLHQLAQHGRRRYFDCRVGKIFFCCKSPPSLWMKSVVASHAVIFQLEIDR
jgi:hypothetical protein